MALQTLTLRDGRTLEVDAPIGASKEILAEIANRQLSSQRTSARDRRLAVESQARKQEEERLRRARAASEDARLVLAESKRGSLARGLDIGTDLVGQATGSALEGIGSLLGVEGLEQYGAEVALENEADIQRKSRFQTRFDDIEGVGDFFSYLGGIAGESAPAMAAGIVGGIGAAAAAPAVGLGALGAGVAGVAGATAANVPFFYGMNRERQKEAVEAGLRTEIDEGAAFLTALPQALLDGIVDRLLVGGLKITDEVIRAGGVFTRAGRGVSAGAVVEAPTEIGQQVLERAQAGLPLDDAEALAEYREAGIAGGLLGGAVRGTAATIGGDSVRQAEARERARLAAIPRLPEDAPSGIQGELFPVDETAQAEAMIDADETAEIEAMVAEDEAVETNAEVSRRQRDMFDELETAELEAEIDAEETAEIETIVAEDERVRKKSDRETRTAAQETARIQEVEGERRAILQDVVENQPTRQLDTLRKRFSRALEAAGVTNPKPTAAEDAVMQRVIDIARAEPAITGLADLEREVGVEPAESDVTELEAQIPERRTADEKAAAQKPGQAAFEGLGRKEQRTEPEPTLKPRLITKEDLDSAGFKSNAAIRKRVIGKDLNDPDTRTDITNVAQASKDQELKIGVNRLLQGVPSEQRDLFSTRKAKPVTGEKRTRDADNLQSVGVPASSRDTTQFTQADPEPVGRTGTRTEQPTTGKRGKSGALKRKITYVIKARTLGTPEVSQPNTETGEITVTFPDGEIRTMKKENGLFVATDLPDKTGVILGETPTKAIKALEKQRTGVQLQREASKKIGATKQKTKLPKQKTAPKKAEETVSKEQAAKNKASVAKERNKLRKQLIADGADPQDATAVAREEITDEQKFSTNPPEPQTTTDKQQEDFPKSRELTEGRRTEKELRAERDKLLKATANGTLIDAVRYVARNANNAFEEVVATKVGRQLQRLADAGVNLSYVIADINGNEEVNGVAGNTTTRFEAGKQLDVKVKLVLTNDATSAHNGVNHRTLLHEAVHAATVGSLMLAERDPKTVAKTNPRLIKDAKDLEDLTTAIQKYVAERLRAYEAASRSPTGAYRRPMDDRVLLSRFEYKAAKKFSNAVANSREVIAWALTDPDMQKLLSKITYNTRTGKIERGTTTELADAFRVKDGKTSLLNAFFRKIAKLLGITPKPKSVENTAFVELLRVSENLLEIGQDTANKLAFAILPADTSFTDRAQENSGLVPRNEAAGKNLLNKAAESVPILNSNGVQRLTNAISDISVPQRAKSFVLSLLSLNGLEMVAKKYVPKVSEVRKLVLQEAGRLLELKQPIDTAIDKISKFAKANKEKVDILNRLMPYSSLIGVDPSKPRSTYKEDADKLAEYDTMTRKGGDYEKLGPEGQAIYKQIHNVYASLFKEVGRAVEARLEATNLDPAARKNVYDELINKLYKKATIDPFFPLLREGEFRLEYEAVDPETGQLEYYTENFKTESARTAAMEELKGMAAKIKLNNMNAFEDLKDANYRDAPAGSFVNNVLGVLDKQKFENDTTKKAVQDEIIKLFLDTLPERSFAQSFRPREGIRGFIGDPRLLRDEKYPNHDMVRSLRVRAGSITRQLVRMEYGSKFQKLQEEIEEDYKKLRKDGSVDSKTKRLALEYTQEIEERIKFAKNPDVQDWAKNLTTFGFTMTLGLNVSSALVNFSQLPMVIAPHLAGTRGEDGELFGYARTTKAIGEAMRLFRNAGITEENVKYLPFLKKRKTIMKMIGAEGMDQTEISSAPSLDNYDFDSKDMPQEIKEFKVLVEVAMRDGQLNRSIVYDLLELDEIDSVRGKIGAVSGFFFHHGERMTRQVALAASYRLMLDSMKRAGRKIDDAAMREAAEFAIYEVELTNGGTAAASAPRIGQKGAGKVAFLYKRYAVQMMELLAKLAMDTYKGNDRKAAMYQLGGVFGGAGLVAGIQGLPVYGAIATVYDLLKGDEDEDLDTVVRKTFGEGWYGGLGNYILGFDVASRMGLSDLIFRDRLIEKDQSLFFDAIEILGGPVVGVGMQMERGFDKMFQQGEFYRGVESISPAAIRNGLKSVRFYEEGALTQRGDVIVKDLNPFLLAGQFLGFAPAEYTRQLAENAQLKKLSRTAATKRTKLLRRYYVANRFGNYAEARKIRRDIAEFNREFPSVRITPDSIKRSMAQHMRTSKRIHSGVTLNPKMFTSLKQSASEYDDTLTIWEDLGI